MTVGIAAAGMWALHRAGHRSGVDDREAKRPLPGDEIVAAPLWVSTRAITIDAPPAEVWPWIVQMGHREHRAAWYTPHWLDKLMWGQRHRSANEIIPELQVLHVGDRVPDSADGSVYYVVKECEPGSHIVLHSRSHVFAPVAESDFSWVFALVPKGGQRTRLYVRARVSYAPLWLYAMLEAVLDIGDFMNARSMLRGIKDRAEGRHSRR